MLSASQEIRDGDESPDRIRSPNHIVLATDFSARCDRAQNRAVQLAVQWNASLTAVHVLSDIDVTDDVSLRDAYRAAARRNANRLREELACVEGLRSSVIVQEGPIDAVLVEAAARERAELLVTGIAGSGQLGQALIGSTVTALARASSVPLLVVKKKVLNKYAKAAVATDLSDSSKPALAAALHWFAFRELVLFHAVDQPYRGMVDDKTAYDIQSETSSLNQCHSFVKDVAGDCAIENLDIIVRRGDPVTGLRILANDADIDLVVSGTHGRTELLHVLFGSVASRILNEVPCDVLVVPSRSR